MLADITLRIAKPTDFKVQIGNSNEYKLRKNYLFFLYNQKNQTMNGPYLLNPEMNLKLLAEYIEKRIVYVCDSHETEIPDNWLPKELGPDEENEQQNLIAC